MQVVYHREELKMDNNNSLKRRLLYISIGLVGLLVVLAVVALQALKSETARSRIATALSSALGQPVTIGGLSASIFPRPSLSASAIQVGGADSSAAPGVSLAALHVVPRLSSLMPGRTLTIDRVDLRGLVISVRRDSAGRWLVPVPPFSKVDTTGEKSGIDMNQLRAREGAIRVVDDQLRAPAGGPQVTTITDVQADLQALAGQVEVSRLTGRLGESVVTGSMDMGPKGATLRLGSETVHNSDLPALFALAGIPRSPLLSIAGKAPFEMRISLTPGFAGYTVTGRAAIERVKFGTLSFEQVQAPFHLEHAVFTLDPLTFTTYGGKQRGAVSIDLNPPAPVYTIRSTVQGMNVDQALSANTTMKNFLAGRGSVAGDVRGSGTTAAALTRSLRGTFNFDLEKGVIRNFPLLAAINQSLGITTGTDRNTEFQSLSGTGTIAGGMARADDLSLRAGELTLKGKGTLGFDRRLDLRMTASASPEMSNQLAQRVEVLKQLSNSKGQVTVPVTVGGTTTAPKFSVDLGSLAQKQLERTVENQALQLLR